MWRVMCIFKNKPIIFDHVLAEPEEFLWALVYDQWPEAMEPSADSLLTNALLDL